MIYMPARLAIVRFGVSRLLLPSIASVALLQSICGSFRWDVILTVAVCFVAGLAIGVLCATPLLSRNSIVVSEGYVLGPTRLRTRAKFLVRNVDMAKSCAPGLWAKGRICSKTGDEILIHPQLHSPKQVALLFAEIRRESDCQSTAGLNDGETRCVEGGMEVHAGAGSVPAEVKMRLLSSRLPRSLLLSPEIWIVILLSLVAAAVWFVASARGCLSSNENVLCAIVGGCVTAMLFILAMASTIRREVRKMGN